MTKKEQWEIALAYINNVLSTGKFIVVPESIYKQIIKLAKKHNFSEKAIKNIYCSEKLPIKSNLTNK